jgi:hypothetical protein
MEKLDISKRFPREDMRKSKNTIDIHILMARSRENPEGSDNRIRRTTSYRRERILIHSLNSKRNAVYSRSQDTFRPGLRNIFGIRFKTDFDILGK